MIFNKRVEFVTFYYYFMLYLHMYDKFTSIHEYTATALPIDKERPTPGT